MRRCLLGCDAFNAAIKDLGTEFEDYTSYSFRRLFVHRVIERFTGEDEMTAWAEVVKLTAHVQIETVRTSYAKKFGGYCEKKFFPFGSKVIERTSIRRHFNKKKLIQVILRPFGKKQVIPYGL